MKTLYVGIDMAHAKFDSAASCKQGQRQVASYTNEPNGYRKFAEDIEAIQAVEGKDTVHLIVEPTAGYQAGLLVFAYRKRWRITLVNPLHIRRWAQGMGKRAKTDVQDAIMLAEYGERTQPDPQEEIPADLQALDLLLRRQQDVKELLQSERNRLFNVVSVTSYSPCAGGRV
jgi:transposase